ncbi:MAG: shikimate dehydrogenase [Cyclobacteriaceae bacterium]|nr:shikimate dehydrogenase [Cyclobacteriaceae bacterium]
MPSHFGLIGYPLGHSFSKQYFENKFKISNSLDTYKLFEVASANMLIEVVSKNNLKGINVTIPHKQKVIPFLDSLDKSAQLVGAVNVIKNEGGLLTGFNSDYPAFKATIKSWLDNSNVKALVLGTGGASKAVIAALNDLKISSQQVSRTGSSNVITYKELAENPNWVKQHVLIINTTPVGTAPHTNEAPEIPYNLLSASHYLYDLVYNPKETLFLKKGKAQGAKGKNGLEMLHLQAELAWDIWNT